MIPALYATATVLLVAVALVYYRGRFLWALAGGLAYAGIATWLAFRLCGGGLGAVLALVFVAAPGGFLAVHVWDAKRGVFLIPTIWSIPLAFLAAAAMWAALTLAWVAG